MDVPERLLAGGPWPGVTLVQVTLVSTLGLLGWAVARRGGAALRGAVVLAALVGLLVVPALARVAPVWLPLSALAHPEPATEPVKSGDTLRLPPPPPVEPPIIAVVVPPELVGKLPPMTDDPPDPFEEFLLAEMGEQFAVTAPLPQVESPPPVEEPAEPRRAPPSAASILVTVWLIGAILYLTRALVCLALLYRWAWRARPIPETEWAACVGWLPDWPRVALRESPAIGSPLTLGLFRPVILLPEAWRDWTAEQLRLVLAHEMAHVRRRDFLAGLVAELAVCVCWFHPVVRWLAGRLRLEQEYAADARAASAAGDAMTYVRCLARLALEQGTGRGSLAPAFWRRRPEILRRIDMLRRNRDGLSVRVGWGTACAVVVLAGAACVAVAGVGPLHVIAELPEIVDAIPADADAAPAEVKATAAAATGDTHGDPLPAGALARLGTTRWRPGTSINYVAFGADDKTLVTAGPDGTIRLWDLGTGKEVRRFARPAPAGRPQPARPGAPGGLPGLPGVPAPVPVPPTPVALERAAAEAQVLVARTRAAATEAAAAAAEAKAKLDAAKPGGEADAAKRRLEAAKAAEEAARARAEAARAQLEAQLRQQVLGGAGANNFVVAVTPDGKTLAVSGSNVIQLYEIDTGNELRKIEGAAGLVALLFSPDGKTLAGRVADGGVVLWNTETTKERHRVKAPPRPVDRNAQVAVLRGGGDTPGMTFTPDSKAIVVVMSEIKDNAATSTVKFWDVNTGEEVRDLKGPLGVVSGVEISPNGKTLAYCTNGIVRAFTLEGGDQLYEIRTNEPASRLQFSPDGKLLAVRGRTQQVRICDGFTGAELYTLSDVSAPTGRAVGGFVVAGTVNIAPEVRTMAFSTDGQRIATATAGSLRLWTSATGKELPLAEGHQAPLVAVVLSPDGKTAVSWGIDRMITRWDTATGKPVGGFRVPMGTTVVAISPDGQTAARVAADNTIRIHETAGGKEIAQFKGYPRGASALVFSPDGKALAERGADGVIRLYDPAKGNELRQLTVQATNTPAPPGAVTFVASGRAGGAGSGMVFSPDGQLLASTGGSPQTAMFVGGVGGPPGRGGPAGVITLFDVGTGKAIRKIESPLSVASFTFSPDGRMLAAENTEGSVSLWEVASGKERARLGGRNAPQPQAQVFPAGVQVVRAGPVSAEPAGPTSLAFSPDGRVLITRGANQSVRVWDVDGGKELGQFAGHNGRIETVSFSPNGKSVASGSADTTVLLWDAAALRQDLPAKATAELPDGMAESLWADLAGEDAGKALRGVLQLAADPRHAVPMLGERLKPAAPIDPQKLEQWVADLESDKFAVRQEASANLVKAGEQVVPALQRVLASQPTIETRKRVEGLLDKLTGGVLSTEQLRLVRGIEALERMATPEAQEVLRTLAGGASGAMPTREARAALDRLGGR